MFIQYHTIRLFEGGEVMSKAEQGSKERREHGRSDTVYRFPN